MTHNLEILPDSLANFNLILESLYTVLIRKGKVRQTELIIDKNIKV